MHPSFLDYLVDPRTAEPLKLTVYKRNAEKIVEGRLTSATHEYPIIRGIPRFAGYQDGKNYTRSFSYQWSKWSKIQFESSNIGRPMTGHTRIMWEKITGITSEDLGGAVIADFGCGGGRFIEVVRMKNGRVIALDLSSAVEAATTYFQDDPNVLVCQADVLNPPLRTESVDGAFSIGVLHHTPDPARGFEQLFRTVRPGGWIAVAVYGKGGYYDFPTVAAYRALFRALWPFFRHYPPLLYSYATTYLLRPLCRIPVVGKPLCKFLRAFFPFRDLPDARWALLDTFDSVTPAYQSAHESYEVFQWFKKLRLSEIEPSEWGFTSYHAIKPR